MRISQRGLDLIKTFEGLELEAYQDIVGIWTIGYGHTSEAGPPKVVPGMEITEEEAEEILRNDVVPFERAVEKAVNVPLTQNMFDALVSITFNIGPGAMRSSTFIRRLNEGNYEGAADALLMWNKAGGKVVNGLKRRREAERALFLDGYDPEDGLAVEEVRGLPVEEDTGRRKNLAQSRTMQGAGTGAAAGGAAIGATLMKDRGDREDEGTEPAEDSAEVAVTVEPAESADVGDGGEPADSDDAGESTETGDDAAAEPAEGSGETGPGFEDIPMERPAGDGQTGTEAGAEVLQDTLFVSRFEDEAVWDAIVVGAGAIAVLSALWVAIARFDDWRNQRR